MAEERLIDDDLNKDKKYRIRVNEDGEEELYIDETEEESEDDIPVFEVQESDVDDEEAAVLTPEQLAERERLKNEAERARKEKSDTLISSALEKISSGDFEGALFDINKAEEVGLRMNEVSAIKLRTLTRDFTDFTRLAESAAYSTFVKEECSAEQKSELVSIAGGYKNKINDLTKECNELKEQNEKGKEERRGYFSAKKKKTLSAFIATAVPFAVFLILAISFSTIMFADENGLYLILSIVFIALAFVALVACVFTGRAFWAAASKVKLNERDSSTEVGRNYLNVCEQLKLVKEVYESFGEV
jgi:hypothetical protein